MAWIPAFAGMTIKDASLDPGLRRDDTVKFGQQKSPQKRAVKEKSGFAKATPDKLHLKDLATTYFPVP